MENEIKSSGFMDSVVSSYPRLIRALLFILFTGATLFFIIYLVIARIYNNGNIDIETNEKGGFIFKVSKGIGSGEQNRKLAELLLPASDCWSDSGLDLEPGEECEFKVTGNVHLALRHLSDDVGLNRIPDIEWTGPNGNPWATIGDKDDCLEAKKKLLISPGDIIGNVVGYGCSNCTGITESNFAAWFLKNRDAMEPGIFKVNAGAKHKNMSNQRERIYLTVNDILLDTTTTRRKQLSRLAYEGRANHPNAQKWDSLIKNDKYYRLWFNDNIGGFLVSVSIK